MPFLVPTFKLGINDAVLLAEGDYRNTACLGLLVVKFKYPFKIFTACHNRIFMFCSAKVTWFMQNASEAIECLQFEKLFIALIYRKLWHIANPILSGRILKKSLQPLNILISTTNIPLSKFSPNLSAYSCVTLMPSETHRPPSIYFDIISIYLFGTHTIRGFNVSGTWNDFVRGATLPFSYHSACIFPSSSLGRMGSRCMLLCKPKTGLDCSSM